MTDIVERLRSWAVFDPCMPPERLMENAADEIEQLRKLLDEALEQIERLNGIIGCQHTVLVANAHEIAELRKDNGE